MPRGNYHGLALADKGWWREGRGWQRRRLLVPSVGDGCPDTRRQKKAKRETRRDTEAQPGGARSRRGRVRGGVSVVDGSTTKTMEAWHGAGGL